MDSPQEQILSLYGMTLAEYNVLWSVSLVDGTRERARLLRHVLFMDSASEVSEVSASLAEEALDACLLKGWVKVLTQEDCQNDEVRWVEEENQAISENEYQEGHMDFTPEGAQLWNRIHKEHAEASGERWASGIRYAWRFAGQVRVFSAYEDELREVVEAIRTGKDILSTEEIRIERIEGPFVLGEWWLNRFVRLPQGYRQDIHYTMDPQEAEAL